MIRRHPRVALVAFFLTLAGFAACGFPTVGIAPSDAGDDAPAVQGADGDPPPDASDAPVTDAPTTDAPGSQAEAAVPDDSGLVEAGKCVGTDPCDCDDDKFKSKENGCGGDDCNDFDKNVHPDQTYVAAAAKPPENGDWNCDGEVDKQYDPNLPCGLGLGGREGFEGNPACGEEADLYRCSCAVVCGKQSLGKRTQACR